MRPVLLLLFVLFSSCNKGQRNEEDFYSMNVYLPDGAAIIAQPARYEVRDALPRLPSGKHDVAALRGEQQQGAWT